MNKGQGFVYTKKSLNLFFGLLVLAWGLTSCTTSQTTTRTTTAANPNPDTRVVVNQSDNGTTTTVTPSTATTTTGTTTTTQEKTTTTGENPGVISTTWHALGKVLALPFRIVASLI